MYIYIYVHIYIYIYIHAIIKTICPSCYHDNGFVATHALGHMCISCHKAIAVITRRALFP